MKRIALWGLLLVIIVGITAGITALLVNIMERKREAEEIALKLVEIAKNEPDPAVWGQNWPRQYAGYLRTRESNERTKYGGSVPYQKVEENPRLKRLFAGNPFSKDYKEDRGHAWSLVDVKETLREPKAGTCMTCKSGNVPGFLEEAGSPAKFYATPFAEWAAKAQHGISCVDCHDAKTMNLRISRPALLEALQRRGVDISKATRQEMRTYVCAQCHVEYYFRGEGKYLTFPWDKGLTIDDIERYYDEYGFKDFTHAESGAPLLKMQHPEFELFTTGIHYQAGVSCADCHMHYKREGAIKISDHWVRSPLLNIAGSCMTCHRASEQELRERVERIQDRTYSLLVRAEEAIIAAIDAIKAAKEAGASDEMLQEARLLHRKAQLRWDFISAENSMGFHSPQEAARILGEAIDYARQAELSALRAKLALSPTQ
jgi:nitrite reductase (cytochrome c-552)